MVLHVESLRGVMMTTILKLGGEITFHTWYVVWKGMRNGRDVWTVFKAGQREPLELEFSTSSAAWEYLKTGLL